jgi:YihY family inner membrane protein
LPEKLAHLRLPLLRLLRFVRRVVVHFFQNKGLLLAGAVGYNTLLSLIPLLAILLVVLSHVFDEQRILVAVATELKYIIPGKSQEFTAALAAFMRERHLIGGIGGLVLLFFSSLAFRMLEDAMAVIFKHHAREQRHPFISAIIPYVFIGFIGLGLGTVTVITGILDSFAGRSLLLFNRHLNMDIVETYILQGVGMIGLIMMLTSIYMVMPTAKVGLKRALIGGITSACLWEIVRTFLVWYFDNISIVNVVYGSLATVIIVLLSLEVAAVIILVGAQIIAELEHSAERGLPWYIDPDDPGAHGEQAPPRP